MTREWKPGDVAMVASETRAWRVFRTTDREGNEVWADATGPLLPDDEWVPNRTIRPLVVIDTEDREQVERLVAAWEAVENVAPGPVPMTARQMRMQAALRSLIAPPKPPEPTGLGAVVEDAESMRWVRGSSMRGLKAWCNDYGMDSEWLSYADITAVRILSEGVDQ